MKRLQGITKAGGCPIKALSAFSLVILLLSPVFVFAQANSADAKSSLKAWTGIWAFSDENAASGSISSFPKTNVEIVPTADGIGLQITRRALDQPEVKEVIIPDGTKRAVDASNCTGFQTARLVAETGMIISSSEMNCKDTGSFATTNIKLILNADQMVDILELKASGEKRLATRRLRLERDLPPTSSMEPTNAGVIARMTAGQAWNLNTVIQLSKTIDTQILEAALVEKQVVLDLNTKALKELKKAKTPKGIIDLLVALAHPEKFQIAKNGQVELRRWVDTSSSSSGRLNTPTYSYTYLPGIDYYPGLFYNCRGGLYPNIYGGYSCWNYYSPLWWDYPVYRNWGNHAGGSGGGSGQSADTNNVRLSSGGYVQIQPQSTSRQAQPRNRPVSGGSYSAHSSVSYPSSNVVIAPSAGSSSSSSSSSSGSSSGGSSSSSSSSGSSSSGGGATVSPSGYSTGGDSGGGRRAVPR